MKIKNIRKNIFLLTALLISFIGNNTYAAKIPRIEKTSAPEIFRQTKLLLPNSTGLQLTQSTALATQSSQTIGANLILNPSFQAASVGGPTNWGKGGYGTNSRTFTYPVTGNTDSKAAQVTITNYTNGDAKWYFDDISVSPGENYQLSDFSLSNIPSVIDVRYKLSDGSFVYKDVAFVNPSATYQKTTVNLVIPANVVSITAFHLIQQNGSLSVDDYSLNKITTTSNNNNLVTNGTFDSAGLNGLPQGWSKGGWGTNTRTFSYPGNSIGSGNSVTVSIGSYTSGDAKWYFDAIPTTSGIYTYSDTFSSNIQSTITVQFNNADGTTVYKDVKIIPPSNSPTTSSVDFSVNAGVKSVSVFHLIEGVGSLTIDNVSLVRKGSSSGVFSTGAVTLRFDDGWLSQYQNAIPKMQASGVKGSFYIVTKQTSDDGFPDFMSHDQIQQVYSNGNEIGAHTRTHPYLSQLSSTDQQTEIQGSRNDLIAMNVGPITSFAYPFGDYNATTISIIKNAGFTSALSTLDGFVSPTSDKYQLERQAVTSDITLAQVKSWVDQAASNKTWLILTFHEINTSGNLYSTAPGLFNQIIDYIVAKNIPVVTASQGIQSLQ